MFDKEKIGQEVIGRAGPGDVDAVWEIIRQCAQSLAASGYGHWQKYYTRELVERMIAKKEVYLVGDYGTVTLGLELPWYYGDEDKKSFTDFAEAGICISALGVKPEEQGRGIAGGLIEFAVVEAGRRRIKWLRLDCREIPSLVRFYTNRGFREVGRQYDENDGVTEVYLLMERAAFGEPAGGVRK